MEVSWQAFAFVSAVAIGAIAEYITQQERNPYRMSIAAGKIFIVAIIIAMIPEIGGKWTLLGLFVARIGDMFGKVIYTALVRGAVRREVNKWDTSFQLDEKHES